MDDAKTAAAARRDPLRVLLVEDNGFDAELTIEYLRKLSQTCDTHVVDNERDFLAAIEQTEFDIVLSDFALPSFSGVEALMHAKRLAPAIPFVFVSGVLGEENAVDMLKLGATDYVVKSRLRRLPFVVERAITEARERRQRIDAERALRESETLLTRVVESLQDYAVILLSPEGIIRSANAASEKIFGYALTELVGKSAEMLFHEQDRMLNTFGKELQQARDQGRASDDRWLCRKDGSLFFGSGVTTALRDQDHVRVSGFSKIVRDTTDQQYAAEALEAAKIVAEEANQAKNRFLAVLSHELRTPLTPILAATQILEMRLNVPEELSQLLPMIRRNVVLEARLIDDLLDLTSIERGKLALNKAKLDVHSAVDHALEMSRNDIVEKKLQLELKLDAQHVDVYGDEARIQQIFWNLLRNAVKFTPIGGSIVVRTFNPDESSIAMEVTDTGIGISDEALPRIFSQFEQADPSITKTFGGLGLGLAIARALAVRHGGNLSAQSRGAGQGATFTCVLPLLGGGKPGDAPATQAVPESAPSLRAGSCHVLLVEDSKDSAEAIRYALEAASYQVSVAYSVSEARSALAADEFDVLVSDIGLPDGSGLDVARAAAGRIPAIALSGYGMTADSSRSLQSGFNLHLVKPVDPNRLDAEIRNLLARRHLNAGAP